MSAAMNFRLARPEDYPTIEPLIIDSFEPISAYVDVEAKMGPFNGHGWRSRWQNRIRKAFDTQIVLVGEERGEVVAYASGVIDEAEKLALLDILAVDRRHHGKGYGRSMLRAYLDHVKQLGAQAVNLECLSDNNAGNSLYESEGFKDVFRTVPAVPHPISLRVGNH